MKDLVMRLKASSRYDTINGDSFDRSVCARQMREAATKLSEADALLEECLEGILEARLEGIRTEAYNHLTDLVKSITDYRRDL